MDKIYAEEKKYFDYVCDELDKSYKKTAKAFKEESDRIITPDMARRGEGLLKENLMAMYAKQMFKMEKAVKSPYFGRMDFRSQYDDDYNKLYIGRIGLTDDNGKTIIIDWRTPVASMFYNNSIGQAQYMAPQGIIKGDINLKRQIVIEDKQLKSVLDTDIVTNDEILQEYLDIHADEKMKNIVASIQSEQNNIIRKPLSRNIIIQGVAGSGKTSVALHRIAYLLYNLKDYNSSDFLLLGPNKYFLDYISSVLPELETEPITQKCYSDFIREYLNEKVLIKNVEPKFKNLKEQEEYNKIKKFKSSLQYKELIDSFMKDYLDGKYFTETFDIDGTVIFDEDFIKESIMSGVLTKFNFEKATAITISRFKDSESHIYNFINEKYRKIYTNSNSTKQEKEEAIKKSTELRNEIYKNGEKNIKNFYKKLNRSASSIYKIFLERIDEYLVGIPEEDRDWFINYFTNSSRKALKEDDLPALGLIKFLTTGKSCNFNQITIDEAQDYGLFHYYTLSKICPKAKFSIYGDLAQSLKPYTSINNWEELNDLIFNNSCELLRLDKSYRTTKEITSDANNILKHINLKTAESVERHGNSVKYCENLDTYGKLDLINSWIESGYKTIGIICRTEKEALALHKELSKYNPNISYLGEGTNKYSSGVHITTSLGSKGLEFDAVLINNASDKCYNPDKSDDMHLLYVAMTRALHELVVSYDNNLTMPLEENLERQSELKKIKCRK